MSTYLYLVCLDHDPPLRAMEESGQHLYDLAHIRADIANREVFVAAVAVGWTIEDYFRSRTMSFLVQHPHCRLIIEDETGREHPLVDPEA